MTCWSMLGGRKIGEANLKGFFFSKNKLTCGSTLAARKTEGDEN